MGLENLKSIFNNNINERIDNYKKNNPQGVGESRIAQNVSTPILDTFSIGQIYTTGSPPILSSVNSFVNNVNDANGKHPFQLKNFLDKVIDAKPPQPAKIPTDYSSAGIEGAVFSPLSKVQQNIYTGEIGLKDLSWENLYQPNHTPKNDPSFQNITPISYPNVDRDKLNIRNSSTKTNLFNFSRNPFLGIGANEPYIVSDIPQSSSSFTGGRLFNQGPLLGIPINRAITDTLRIGQYLTSPAGVGFILAQNFLGKNTKNIFLGKDGGVFSSEQRFKKAYNPASTLLQTLGRAGFGPVGLLDKTEPDIKSLFGSEKYGSTNVLGGNIPFDVNESYNKGSGGESNAFGFKQFKNELISKFKAGAGVPTTVRETSHGGDVMTLAPMVDGTTLLELDDDFFTREDFEQDHPDIKSEKNGMPFYFKDMRDNTYVFFRAYIEGLTENISPTYASHNYIGRSEPVYTYERAEREISMTLKLVAQTRQELTEIYKKMDRLTSMCYPQYVDEDNPDTTDIREGYGNRMKPPLAKLRYGEMYGKTDKELMGYMKSISYSVEQSSTYETEVGARVPRHVTATIGYQVIHDKAPRLGTTFYGINQNG